MTTKQMIARLKPLRADVSQAHQLVLDKLAIGASRDDCKGRMERWRACVRTYLDALDGVSVDNAQLQKIGKRLRKDLETTFDGDLPTSGVDAWKAGKELETKLIEYEVACDLRNGAEATRAWLLSQDYRLRYAMRRTRRIPEEVVA